MTLPWLVVPATFMITDTIQSTRLTIVRDHGNAAREARYA